MAPPFSSGACNSFNAGTNTVTCTLTNVPPNTTVNVFIEAGVERASAYGITGEGEVCRFVDLMFGFGHDFDSSAAFAWAVPLLRDEHKTPAEKLGLIFAELMKMSQQQESAVAGD